MAGGNAALEALVSPVGAEPCVETDACRSCGHAGLSQVLDLGRVPLANALLTAEQLHEPEDRFPLELYFCPQCALVQIGETVPPERLFRDYAYASSFSDTMVEHARTLVETLIGRRGLGPASLVIEVGEQRRIPAAVLQGSAASRCSASSRRPTSRSSRSRPRAFRRWSSSSTRSLPGGSRRKASSPTSSTPTTCSRMFPIPTGSSGGIKQVLKPDGVAVVEAPYVRDLIAKLEFDTIYHEHFSYYSVSAVEALCRRHGLAYLRRRARADPRRLAAAVHRACGPAGLRTVVELLAKEKAEGLLTFDYYRDFGDRVALLKQQLLALLQRLQGEGRRIAAYGASAKGSTLMNAFGIDAETDRVRGRPLEPQAGPLHAGQPPADPAAGSACSSAGRTTFYC